jgi:hypothetical protein
MRYKERYLKIKDATPAEECKKSWLKCFVLMMMSTICIGTFTEFAWCMKEEICEYMNFSVEKQQIGNALVYKEEDTEKLFLLTSGTLFAETEALIASINKRGICVEYKDSISVAIESGAKRVDRQEFNSAGGDLSNIIRRVKLSLGQFVPLTQEEIRFCLFTLLEYGKLTCIRCGDYFYECDLPREKRVGRVLRSESYANFQELVGALLKILGDRRRDTFIKILNYGIRSAGIKVHDLANEVAININLENNKCRDGLIWLNKAMHTEVQLAAMIDAGLKIDRSFGISSLYIPCMSCKTIMTALKDVTGGFAYIRADNNTPPEKQPPYNSTMIWSDD